MFNKRSCSLIGVVHVDAMPGAAGYNGDMNGIVEKAVKEAELYKLGGMDAIIIENMHDAPYLKGQVEPETTAAMAVVGRAVKAAARLPVGIQILAGANIEALGAAIAGGLDFIRVEGFVYAHVADEGIIESCAARLIRRRATLKAEHIKIFTDIKKKHSAHAITADVDIVDTAVNAEFFRADGLVVSGKATGLAADAGEVRAVKEAVGIPVLVGSGINFENISEFARIADGLIVGTAIKVDGHWANPVDRARVERLVGAMKSAV